MAIRRPSKARIADWQEIHEWLPTVLEQLLTADVYSDGQPKLPKSHGRYLFSVGDKPLYVGRTGITGRTRRAGREPTSNFRARFANHTLPSSSPGSAPFAMRLAIERALDKSVPLPTSGWWKRRDPADQAFRELFLQAKSAVRVMELRIAPFEDDDRGVHSTIAEIYTHSMLRTPYNSFATS